MPGRVGHPWGASSRARPHRIPVLRLDSARPDDTAGAATHQGGRSDVHAPLVKSRRTFGNVDITLSIKTIKQLRTPRPNPWEMAWVLWHYTDDVHFYYLVLKTNGWELGKEDPAYPGAQRYLITRSSPRFKPGVWYSVHIRQIGRVITVWVGRTKLGAFWDRQRAYLSGSLGLYCEDSRVAFDDVKIVQA